MAWCSVKRTGTTLPLPLTFIRRELNRRTPDRPGRSSDALSWGGGRNYVKTLHPFFTLQSSVLLIEKSIPMAHSLMSDMSENIFCLGRAPQVARKVNRWQILRIWWGRNRWNLLGQQFPYWMRTAKTLIHMTWFKIIFTVLQYDFICCFVRVWKLGLSHYGLCQRRGSVLRTISGLKRKELTGRWRKLNNREFHNLYFSSNINRVTKTRSTNGRDRKCLQNFGRKTWREDSTRKT
jgi:hypothetical protein